MGHGILTDSFSLDRVRSMDQEDWRRGTPGFREPGLSRGIALRDALRPIAVRHGTTVAAVSVAWTLAWTGVTGAIVGARSATQVDGWASASGITLTVDDLDEIAVAIERLEPEAVLTRPV